MNLNNLSTQLLYTTVPIIAEKSGNTTMSGTGLFYNFPHGDNKDVSIPFIVTNRHVVHNTKKGIFQFVTRDGDVPNKDNRVRVEFDPNFFKMHSDPRIDLAAAPIAPLLLQAEQNSRPVFYRAIDPSIIPNSKQLEDLGAIEDVVFIGYPSGIFDTFNATPIARRGITATPVWNDYNNEKKFLVDAGVFPGSSGSPVFILNQGAYASGGGLHIGTRLYFMGILDTSLVVSSASDANRYFIGLGTVIKSEVIHKFLADIATKLVTSP